MLGIDGEMGQLRPACLFSYILTGLVFTGQALLAECSGILLPSRQSRAGSYSYGVIEVRVDA